MDGQYHWAIIGAGPAGIAALGQLLDKGVAGEKILWLDPYFEAGDFGRKWHHVSSNTRVQLFLDYLNACRSFEWDTAPEFELNKLNPKDTCLLKYMGEPLRWLTTKLKQKCVAQQTTVTSLSQAPRGWQINTQDQSVAFAHNVILAIGAKPMGLAYQGPEVISIENVLNENAYPNHFNEKDRVAVFGSSHSAVIALKHLSMLPVKEILHFYRAPLKFAVYLEDMILFDDSGLKGKTAAWAKANLLGTMRANIKQIYSDEKNVALHLTRCNKVVYATGFEKTPLEIIGMPIIQYDPHLGIIAPGLFGCGIAFPEKHVNRFGHQEYRVGLWKFMAYLQRVMPIWLAYSP